MDQLNANKHPGSMQWILKGGQKPYLVSKKVSRYLIWPDYQMIAQMLGAGNERSGWPSRTTVFLPLCQDVGLPRVAIRRLSADNRGSLLFSFWYISFSSLSSHTPGITRRAKRAKNIKLAGLRTEAI